MSESEPKYKLLDPTCGNPLCITVCMAKTYVGDKRPHEIRSVVDSLANDCPYWKEIYEQNKEIIDKAVAAGENLGE